MPTPSETLPGGIAGPGPGRSTHDIVLDFIKRYRYDSEAYVREVLGVGYDVPGEPPRIAPFQLRALKRYDKRTRKQSIRSGHGVGKTALLAWLISHHNLFEFPQRTAVTAPTGTQLDDALVPEVKRWVAKLPEILQSLLEVKTEHIKFVRSPAESFTTFKTSRPETPEALAGVHSAEGSVLLVVDEGSGVDDKVYESAGGSMSGPNAMTIIAGNPVRSEGFFYDTHTKFAEMWNAERVSVFESPFSGGQAYADEVAATYGIASNVYRVRVLGEFPTSEDDTVIPLELVLAAQNREVTVQHVPIIWGGDVAYMGNDRSTLAKRRGNVLIEIPKAWSKLECEDVAARFKTEWDTDSVLGLQPAVINIDSIGYGACVIERLRLLGLPARGVNVAETGSLKQPDVYRDLRTELWFLAREWLSGKDVKLPQSVARDDNMERLVRELTLVTFDYTPQSRKLYIESKKELKSRGFDSPDLADAFVLTFASDAIALVRGGRMFRRSAERKPLRIA